MDFYTRVIGTLRAQRMKPDDTVFVVCGGMYDAETLLAAGCTHIVVSNLDEGRRPATDRVRWEYQDAEAIKHDDDAFDWVVVNGGLHHCASPHRALLEMFRLARKGVVVLEARDSALMRAAVRLGFTPDFEIYAVVLDNYVQGGVRNGPVPNYIYRWTEREFRKTLESARPELVHEVQFFYGLHLPTQRFAMSGPVFRAAAALLGVAARCAQFLMPSQGNEFGLVAYKTGRFKPWIDSSGDRMRRDYAVGFDPAKYS